MADVERLARLRSLGLPAYPAQAYLALLDQGPCSARDLAMRSSVPIGKIYHALDHLAQKGLVEVIPGAPKTYAALSLRRYLGPLWQSMASALHVIEGAASPAPSASSPRSALAPFLRRLPEAALVAQLHGPIQEWNAACAGLFGFTEEEARHLPLHGLVAHGSRSQLRRRVEIFATQGDAEGTVETTAVTKRGHEFPARLTLLAIPPGDGEPPRVGALVHPLAERGPSQAPRAARRGGLAILQQGRLVRFDGGLARLLGYAQTPQAPGSRWLLPGVDPEGRTALVHLLQDRMHADPPGEHYRSALVDRHGRRIPVEVAIRPAALRGGEGLVAFVREFDEG
jgi:PAS domain S-box-containing protein